MIVGILIDPGLPLFERYAAPGRSFANKEGEGKGVDALRAAVESVEVGCYCYRQKLVWLRGE